MAELTIHVLFRYSKKTGKIDTTMTGLGSAQMQWWALNNTTKTKGCLVVERDTGKVVFATEGTSDGFPQVIKFTEQPYCTEYGISLEDLQSITDDRFDN